MIETIRWPIMQCPRRGCASSPGVLPTRGRHMDHGQVELIRDKDGISTAPQQEPPVAARARAMQQKLVEPAHGDQDGPDDAR